MPFPTFPKEKLGDTDKSLIYKEEITPREFIYNKQEWANEFRNNIIAEGECSGVSTTTLYEVPKGRAFHLCYAYIGGYNANTSSYGVVGQLWFGANNKNILFLCLGHYNAVYSSAPFDNQLVSFSKPLIIREGEKIQLRCNIASANVRGIIEGYEE